MKKLLFFPFHDTQNLPKNENVEKEETWNNSVQINVGKRLLKLSGVENSSQLGRRIDQINKKTL